MAFSTALERPPRPAPRVTPVLEGELAAFSVFEVLEILGFLKRSGTLRLIQDTGEGAECWLEEGALRAATYRHRRGPEALLSVLDWDRGTFEFVPGPVPREDLVAPFSVASVMLEAMRLEDELERRRELLPAPEDRLYLAEGKRCPDAVGCGLADLIAEIGAHPGTTLAALERDSVLCPAKVRLGVTQLAFCHLLAPKSGPTLVPAPAAPPVTLAACYRVLVALGADAVGREVPQLLHELGRSLGAPAVTSNNPGQGPAFARFRPGGGNVLSVSFVGIVREHRLLFDSFAGSVDLVLMDPEGSDEARRWFAEKPAAAKVIAVPGPGAVTATLLAHLPPAADAPNP